MATQAQVCELDELKTQVTNLSKALKQLDKDLETMKEEIIEHGTDSEFFEDFLDEYVAECLHRAVLLREIDKAVDALNKARQSIRWSGMRRVG